MILLAVLTFIAFVLNVVMIVNHLRQQKSGFSRPLVLVLSVGLFQLLFNYVIGELAVHKINLVLSFPLVLLYSPALLCLTAAKNKNGTLFIAWYHYLPFVFGFVFYLILANNSALRYQYQLDFYQFMHLFAFLQFSIYGVWINIGYRPADNGLLPAVNRDRWQWQVLCLLLFVSLLVSLYNMTVNRNDLVAYQLFVQLLYLLFLLTVATFSITENAESLPRLEKPLFTETKPVGVVIATVGKDNQNTVACLISAELKLVYREKIELFIQLQGFLDSNMNKDKFCKQLNINCSHLAPFLKEEFGKGFNGFLNSLRISYAVTQLSGGELLSTIDDLAYTCGFNSRASFYRNFQAEHGCSPHQFKLNLNKKP